MGSYQTKRLDLLLVLFPLAVAGKFLHWPAAVVFSLSALGVVPLAGIMGVATEELALYVGPRAGGLLNATLGNAAELIITLFALRAGLTELVLASITGSILGNLLLVLGMSLLAGGLRWRTQTFDRAVAGTNSVMCLLAIAGLAVPSLFIAEVAKQHGGGQAASALSVGAALLLLLIYVLNLVYDFTRETGTDPSEMAGHGDPTMSRSFSVTLLLLATLGIAWLSEILVGSVEATTASLGWSEYFIGIIIIPLVGNVAEHAVAVQMALKNKMELSMAISLGSSLQVALFVAPVLVLVSVFLGHPLHLTFDNYEVEALLAAGIIAAFIAQDGESNWLEGSILLVLYALIAVAFFFVR
ncbi:MAG: calcium/proton exchanger [Armatimonadetes bacterium]|nr:calcium/proton exchanger [Armatimonadota bacterium]